MCTWYPSFSFFQSPDWVKVYLVSIVFFLPVSRLGQGVPGIHRFLSSSLQTGSRCTWYPSFSFFQSPDWVKVYLVSIVFFLPVSRLGQGVPSIHRFLSSSLQTGSRCTWYPSFSFFQSPDWVKVYLVSIVFFLPVSRLGQSVPGIHRFLSSSLH